jgi:peroxiredoxin
MLLRNHGSMRFWLGVGLGLALSAANGVLIVQNLTLKRELAALSQQHNRDLEVKPGTVLSTLAGVDEDGNYVTIKYREGQVATVLLVFSPTCGWCTRNWPQWQTLVGRLSDSRVRTIAASLSGSWTDWHAREHRLNRAMLLGQLDPGAILTHHLLLTPQTIVIDRDGEVRGVWTGRLDGARLREVESTLKACYKKAPVVAR